VTGPDGDPDGGALGASLVGATLGKPGGAKVSTEKSPRPMSRGSYYVPNTHLKTALAENHREPHSGASSSHPSVLDQINLFS